MKRFQFGGILLFLMISSCSTSDITTSWKAENTSAKRYKKIIVMGLIGDPDRSIREKMEEHMAGDLKDLGYDAVTAVSEYGPKAFENMKEEEAVKKLNDRKIDAVVTVVLLNKTMERNYVPKRMQYSPYAIYHNNFWGYYSTMHGRTSSKNYYEVNTKYFWETNFYDLDGRVLLYSAQSQSFDPESPGRLGHEYGLMIVKDMVKKNILEAQPTKALKSF